MSLLGVGNDGGSLLSHIGMHSFFTRNNAQAKYHVGDPRSYDAKTQCFVRWHIKAHAADVVVHTPTCWVRRLQGPCTFAEPAPEPEAKEPAPAEPTAVSRRTADYYYLARFNTPYNRPWHVLATQTRETASRSMPYSTRAVLGTFSVLE